MGGVWGVGWGRRTPAIPLHLVVSLSEQHGRAPAAEVLALKPAELGQQPRDRRQRKLGPFLWKRGELWGGVKGGGGVEGVGGLGVGVGGLGVGVGGWGMGVGGGGVRVVVLVGVGEGEHCT